MQTFNIVIAISLLCIGGLGLFKRPNLSTFILLLFNSALATWILCSHLYGLPEFIPYIQGIINLQLVMALTFTSLFFCLTIVYPRPRRQYLFIIPILYILGFTYGIVYSDYFVQSVLVDGKPTFNVGFGYTLYGLAFILMWLASFYNLYLSYHEFEAHKATIFFFATGTCFLIFIVTITNIILPIMNVYDFIFMGKIMPLGIAWINFYAITKHDFLDIKFVVKPMFSWLTTFVVIFISTSILLILTYPSQQLHFLTMLSLIVFWAFFARRLQVYLTTTSKNKFLKGWYDGPLLVNTIMDKLAYSFEQMKIFSVVKDEIESAFELEELVLIAAHHNQNKEIEHYVAINGKNEKLERSDSLILYLSHHFQPQKLDEFPTAISQSVKERFGFTSDKLLVMPLNSPQNLEGIMILGERGSGVPYTNKEIELIKQIQNSISAALYRLTPLSEMEKMYFETQEKINWMRAFSANIAHELRTPLASIKLANSAIKKSLGNLEGNEPEKSKAAMHVSAEKIDNVITHAQKTIQILLQNARQSKIDTSEFDSFSVSKIISEAIEEYPFYEGQLELVHFENKNDFNAHISDSLLKFVLFNLIKNALYYIHAARKGEIFISMRSESDKHILYFKDTGSGINQSILPKIFDEFYSSKPAIIGHGLGLSFCKHVMQAFEGDIQCEAVEGEYTNFILSFPKIDK